MPDLIKRCTKCVLPSTWPGITFNSEGICNVCTEYKKYSKIDWKKRQFALKRILSEWKAYAWDVGISMIALWDTLGAKIRHTRCGV